MVLEMESESLDYGNDGEFKSIGLVKISKIFSTKGIFFMRWDNAKYTLLIGTECNSFLSGTLDFGGFL